MSKLETRVAENFVGSGLAFAYAVKAGPWIFLNGHEAVDFEAGLTEAVSGPPGFPLFGLRRERREGDFILHRMRAILKEFGSDLPNGVRLDQYYPTHQAVDPYHVARHNEFKDYIPPSTSVVMERCFSRSANASASMLAVVPSPDYTIQKIFPKDITSPPTSGFVPAVTCNEFVFVAGQLANSQGKGLDPRAHVADHAYWGGTEIRKQTEFLITHKLAPALEAAGSSLKQSLKAQAYIEDVKNFPDFLDVWNRHFKDSPCAVSVVPTKGFGTVGTIIEINLLALKDGASRKKEIVEAHLPRMATYGPCIKAGEFLLPSGLLAVGNDGYIVDQARGADFDGLAQAGYAQASAIYDYAESLCKVAGTSMENALRAIYFVSNVSEFAGVARAWTARYGARPHPFVCVGTPPMPAPGAVVMADFWIYAG